MRNMNMGFLALLGVGSYLVWRNRFQIQRFLESQGVNIPLKTSNLGETVRSGIAKVTGSTEHGVKSVAKDIHKAV